MKAIFYGTISKGVFSPADPVRWAITLNALAGKEVELTIGRRRKARSLNQNAYYWGVVIEVSSKLYGYEPEEMHEAFKAHFLATEDVRTGLKRIRSTTSLSTIDFNEYIERIAQKVSEDWPGAYVPEPGIVEGEK